MKISFSTLELPQRGVLVVGVMEDRELTPSARQIDERLEGAIRRAIDASRFRGKKDQTLAILAPARSDLARVQVVGLGKAGDIDVQRLQSAGGQIYAALAGNGHNEAWVAVDALEGCPLAPAEMAAEMALGAMLRSYRFSKYLTKEGEDDKPSLSALTFGCDDPDAAELFKPRATIAEAVYFTRDLVS